MKHTEPVYCSVCGKACLPVGMVSFTICSKCHESMKKPVIKKKINFEVKQD